MKSYPPPAPSKPWAPPYPRLFRPPDGSFDATTLSELRRAGMLMVLWSVTTKDWSEPGTQPIVYTAVSGARPGAIILMHDGAGRRGQTIAALPRIILGLRQRGYRLVTVPQLVTDDPPPRHQPPPPPTTSSLNPTCYWTTARFGNACSSASLKAR